MTALSPTVGKDKDVQVGVRVPSATGSMATSPSWHLGGGSKSVAWPAALVGVVVLKALLSLALKPDSLLLSYSSILYFLLLLLATGLAVRNGIQDTLQGRPFWLVLATAYGLWALDQAIHLYYQLGPHMDVPHDSIAHPVLFLHVVVVMMAVATLPHRIVSERKRYPSVFHSVLILIFWSFLYVYAVFPYQLFGNASSYALRFDVLYAVENWSLLLVVGILTIRAQAAWKAVYFHVLGASTVYAISSTIANIQIDTGGYLNGKLYGLGLTAAVCWYVWIPLRGRQLEKTEVKALPRESISGPQGSEWAMLVVVVITVPIVWELLRAEQAFDLRTFRMLVAIAGIVCLASVAFIKEYFVKSDLASHLSSANDRLRWAMGSGGAVGWEWDVRSGRVSWFGDLKANFGIDTFAENATDFFHRYVHEEDRERVLEAVTEARKSRKSYAGEFRIVRPAGIQRWVTAKGEFRYSAKGEPERMLGTAVDITDRKQLQNELLESQGRISAIVESAMDAIIAIDEGQKIVLFNAAAEKMFGCRSEQAVGTSIERFIPQRFRHRHSAHIRHFGEGGATSRTMGTLGTLWALRASGEEFPIEASISYSNASGEMLFTVIIRDVTEQKRAEQDLRKSEERFRLFMDHSPSVAWLKDGRGHYIYMSETYLKHFGIRPEDRLGKTDFEIYPRPIAEQFRMNDAAALAAGQPVEFTEESVDVDGNPCTWLAYKFPFHDASGQLFVGGIGLDITERKKSEEILHNLTGRLISAQEEERARIARELHDDFSQRLALLGISLGQLWKKLRPDDVEERDSILEMLKSTKEMSSDLHTLSHQLHSSKLEHVGLGPALTGLCKEIGVKYKTEIQFTQNEKSPNIPKDVALCLFRVTQEALANVVKHSHSKSALVELGGSEEVVTLRISDSGKGFDVSLPKPNAGIGMIGMRERLRLVGGKFEVKSEPNEGTEIFAAVLLTAPAEQKEVRTQATRG